VLDVVDVAHVLDLIAEQDLGDCSPGEHVRLTVGDVLSRIDAEDPA